jgi:ERCC4-type nuclease
MPTYVVIILDTNCLTVRQAIKVVVYSSCVCVFCFAPCLSGCWGLQACQELRTRTHSAIDDTVAGGSGGLLVQRFRNLLFHLKINQHPLVNKVKWSEADILEHTVSAHQREELALVQEFLMLQSQLSASSASDVFRSHPHPSSSGSSSGGRGRGRWGHGHSGGSNRSGSKGAAKPAVRGGGRGGRGGGTSGGRGGGASGQKSTSTSAASKTSLGDSHVTSSALSSSSSSSSSSSAAAAAASPAASPASAGTMAGIDALPMDLDNAVPVVKDLRSIPSIGTPGATFDRLLPDSEVLFQPIDDLQLEGVWPTFVILFDPTVRAIRQLEVYQATFPDRPVRIYFLMYEQGSVEDTKFHSALKREREAFASLIRAKETLMIDLGQDGKDTSAQYAHEVFALNEASSSSSSSSSRKGGKIVVPTQPKILVDAREFRSQLPGCLHHRGVHIQPITLEIGDYILTPTIAVERKSLSDLIGSFASGRLYNQMSAMCRYFTHPYLLIEFDANQPFSLYHAANDPIRGSADAPSYTPGVPLASKLVLLTLHFPALRIFWSRSPTDTASLFVKLKVGQSEPDAATCTNPSIVGCVGVGVGV